MLVKTAKICYTLIRKNDCIHNEEQYSGKRIKRGLYYIRQGKSKSNDDVEIHDLRDRGLTIPLKDYT